MLKRFCPLLHGEYTIKIWTRHLRHTVSKFVGWEGPLPKTLNIQGQITLNVPRSFEPFYISFVINTACRRGLVVGIWYIMKIKPSVLSIKIKKHEIQLEYY